MRVLAALILCAMTGVASAQPVGADRYPHMAMMSAQDVSHAVRKGRAARKPPPRTLLSGFRREVSAAVSGRPAGCPARFCGCALSIKLFGRIIPTLNLAANWLRFPRAAAAPGMVAARRGHVFKLLAHRGGHRWQVWDANSGRGQTRIHDRSIAGYTIVNPRGAT